jgi:hypothetical protein
MVSWINSAWTFHIRAPVFGPPTCSAYVHPLDWHSCSNMLIGIVSCQSPANHIVAVDSQSLLPDAVSKKISLCTTGPKKRLTVSSTMKKALGVCQTTLGPHSCMTDVKAGEAVQGLNRDDNCATPHLRCGGWVAERALAGEHCDLVIRNELAQVSCAEEAGRRQVALSADELTHRLCWCGWGASTPQQGHSPAFSGCKNIA